MYFFWHKLDGTVEKTRPRVTTDQQTWKWEKWKLLHTTSELDRVTIEMRHSNSFTYEHLRVVTHTASVTHASFSLNSSFCT